MSGDKILLVMQVEGDKILLVMQVDCQAEG